MRAYYHARRAEALAMLGGKCVMCGSSSRLDFDHIDPVTKLSDLGLLLTRARSVWIAELKKCQLLCRPCHIKKTRICGEIGNHGSSNGQSKLDETKVRDVLARLLNGESGASIAKLYSVSGVTISLIKRGKSWAHVSRLIGV